MIKIRTCILGQNRLAFYMIKLSTSNGTLNNFLSNNVITTYSSLRTLHFYLPVTHKTFHVTLTNWIHIYNIFLLMKFEKGYYNNLTILLLFFFFVHWQINLEWSLNICQITTYIYIYICYIYIEVFNSSLTTCTIKNSLTLHN